MRFFAAKALEKEVTKRVNWIKAAKDWVRKEIKATMEPMEIPSLASL